MMVDSMVERVAKAIAFAEGDDYYESSRFFEKAALAAIEAMREPTEAMKDAACEIGPDTNSGQFDYDNASDIWQAMINAVQSLSKS